MVMIFFSAVFLTWSMQGFGYSREIYVSSLGKDTEHCANISNPCKTIRYAFDNVISSNDTIKIDGSASTFTIKDNIRISQPMVLTFTSYNGTVWIYGDGPTWRTFYHRQFLVVENYESLQKSVITFKNISFRDTALAKLGHYNDVLKIKRKVILRVINCQFKFSNFELHRTKYSYWPQQAIITINMPFTEIAVKNTIIKANHQAGVIRYPGTKGCINLSSTKIIFTDTRIENARYSLYSWSPSCTNMFTKKGIRLHITRCLVESNGERVSRKPQFAIAFGILHKHTKWMFSTVKQSRFEGLSVISKTAAAIDIRGPSRVAIRNCTFKGNVGNRGGALSFGFTTVTISDSLFDSNEARLSTICANKDEGGNGGAIFVYGQGMPRTINIFENYFINNTATCFGSAVYIGYYVRIRVGKTRFITHAANRISSKTVWFSYSQQLSMKQVDFEVGGQGRVDGAIFLARYRKLRMRERTLKFKCPNGSAVNISSHYSRISREIAKEVKCHYCPKETYTLRPNSVTGIADAGKVKKELQTQCQSCSFGAVCKRGIKPQPNFWGYVYKSKAIMLICPPGYCCQEKSKCVTLNSCNDLRTGRLCGKCKKGYFQSIFTSECLHERYCKTGKFWALAISCCLLFTILFIFLQDVFLVIVRLLSMKIIMDMIKRKFELLYGTLSCMNEVSNNEEGDRYDNEPGTTLMNTADVDDADGTRNQTSKPDLHNNSIVAVGLIKIFFFYYQIHSILTVYRSNEQIQYLSKIKGVVLSVFNLNVQVALGSHVQCPLHGMDSTAKILIKALFPINCLILAITLFALLQWLFSSLKSSDCCQKYATKAKLKLLTAILQLILLGYSTVTSSIMSLVSCLSLANGQKILYIDGNVSCYQPWQYAALLCIVLWAVPLIYALHKLPSYMRNGEISIRGFYMSLFLPLPFSTYTMVRAARKMQCFQIGETEPEGTSNDARENEDRTMSQLLNVLAGPFRYDTSRGQQLKLSWEPVLLLQRILLSFCHIFILEPGSRSLVLLLLVFILANLNFMYRPFNSCLLNATNCLIFILLGITGVINMIYALIYEYGTIPKGPLVHLLAIFDYVEVVMILIFPFIAALGLAILACAKICIVVASTVRRIFATCSDYWSK